MGNEKKDYLYYVFKFNSVILVDRFRYNRAVYEPECILVYSGSDEEAARSAFVYSELSIGATLQLEIREKEGSGWKTLKCFQRYV